jgi:hypothetical protein
VVLGLSAWALIVLLLMRFLMCEDSLKEVVVGSQNWVMKLDDVVLVYFESDRCWMRK